MGEQPTDLQELAKKLAAPFPIDWVKWRVQGKPTAKGTARAVCYVDARAVMGRLDEVLGVGNWRSTTRHEGAGWICRLGIRVVRADGVADWVDQEDGADESDIEKHKGGISDAFKRAAVRFGVFAYGYDAPKYWAPVNDKGYMPDDWRPADKDLPTWFFPGGVRPGERAQQQRAPEPKAEPKPEPQPPPARAPEGQPQHVAHVINDMGVPNEKASAALKRIEQARRLVPVSDELMRGVFLRIVDTAKAKETGMRYVEFAESALRPAEERAKSGTFTKFRWVLDRKDLANRESDRDQGLQWRDWTSGPLYRHCQMIDEWLRKVWEAKSAPAKKPEDGFDDPLHVPGDPVWGGGYGSQATQP